MYSTSSRTVLRRSLSQLRVQNETRSFSTITRNKMNPMTATKQFRNSTTMMTQWEINRLFSSNANNEEKAEAKTNEEATQTENTEETTSTIDEATEAAAERSEEDEVEKLKAQIKDYKDQLLRSLADQENTRNIAKRDVEAARNFSVSSFAKSLLETSDNLTRAMEAVPEELRKDTGNNPVLATLYEGIHMTDNNLTKAFQKHGLKKFGILGEKFDPNKHEALFEYPDESKTPGTIGQVMKVGFELNGRVIRSAEVGVIKKA